MALYSTLEGCKLKLRYRLSPDVLDDLFYADGMDKNASSKQK